MSPIRFQAQVRARGVCTPLPAAWLSVSAACTVGAGGGQRGLGTRRSAWQLRSVCSRRARHNPCAPGHAPSTFDATHGTRPMKSTRSLHTIRPPRHEYAHAWPLAAPQHLAAGGWPAAPSCFGLRSGTPRAQRGPRLGVPGYAVQLKLRASALHGWTNCVLRVRCPAHAPL